MRFVRGIGVHNGIAIGPALRLGVGGDSMYAQREILPEAVDAEIERLRQALVGAARNARASRDSVAQRLGDAYGAIFAAQGMLFDDPSFFEKLETLIRSEKVSAEYAVSSTIQRIVRVLQGMGRGPFFGQPRQRSGGYGTADFGPTERPGPFHQSRRRGGWHRHCQ